MQSAAQALAPDIGDDAAMLRAPVQPAPTLARDVMDHKGLTIFGDTDASDCLAGMLAGACILLPALYTVLSVETRTGACCFTIAGC